MASFESDFSVHNSFSKYHNDLSSFSEYGVNNFSILHLNIRSFNKNFDSLQVYLHLLKFKFSVLCFTETWTKPGHDNKAMYKLPGYKPVFLHRKSYKDERGGGVAIYINDSIKFTKIKELTFVKKHFESLFVEIQLPLNGSKFVIGTIYRPPDHSVNDFNVDILPILERYSTTQQKCFILGDFNIDLFKADSHQPTGDFLYKMLSNSFINFIDNSTRITDKSSTLIDNIFSNCFSNFELVSGILINSISDHFPIFTIVPNCKVKCKLTKTITYQNMSDYAIAGFRRKLLAHDWTHVLNDLDANQAYNSFYDVFYMYYCQSFPIITRKSSTYKDKKHVWFSKGLLISLKRKDSLYKKYVTSKAQVDKDKFVHYRNIFNSCVRSAKKLHYNRMFNNAKDPKETWKIINHLINKKPLDNSYPFEFKCDNVTYSDNISIADGFNKCFAQTGPKLAKEIQTTDKHFSSFLGPPQPNSIFISPTNPLEIEKVVSKFKDKHSKGIDGISQKILKKVIDIISVPLSHIFNQSLSTGHIPDSFKISKIIPLFKSGDPSSFDNYRPISILPCISKILDKLVYIRLIKFLDRYKIISLCQFGFRKNHSTTLATTVIIDKIIKNLDNGLSSVGIYLDLSRAFDTVDHDILLRKLKHYGIRGIPLLWFHNYLKNRYQTVVFKDNTSKSYPVHCGVPQGSILGPILFILYINDLENASRIFNLIMFADDANAFTFHRNINMLNVLVNSELHKLNIWFRANRLSLNLDKTHYMVFQSSVA